MSLSSKQYLDKYIQQNKHQFQTPEQMDQLSKIEEYLRKNKIDALLNEIIVGVVSQRPDNVKTGFLGALKKIKAGQRFFKKEDFEDMFQNYNFFEQRNNHQVHSRNLIQCLGNISIQVSEQELLQKYPSLRSNSYLGKEEFVRILNQEYLERTAFL